MVPQLDNRKIRLFYKFTLFLSITSDYYEIFVRWWGFNYACYIIMNKSWVSILRQKPI